jgi:hypothetical protein
MILVCDGYSFLRIVENIDIQFSDNSGCCNVCCILSCFSGSGSLISRQSTMDRRFLAVHNAISAIPSFDEP